MIYVALKYGENSLEISLELYAIACGLSRKAIQYSRCLVRGYRFHTTDRERYRKTQNCGVVVEGSHGDDNIDFYGIVKNIIALKVCRGIYGMVV